MRKILLVLLVAAFPIGCKWRSDISSDFRYYQDARTDLCFYGRISIDPQSDFLTNVPCTPEVLGQIEISKQK